MTSMWFGVISHTPASEESVRSTIDPVKVDEPASMASQAPEFNQPISDPDPDLGIAPRDVASMWVQGEKFVPSWIPRDAEDVNHNYLIDSQIASSGTAAQREAAGIFGHGSLSYAVGIEPVEDLRPGGGFTNEYFVGDPVTIQEGAGNYMSLPPGEDDPTNAKNAATAVRNSQLAAAEMYRRWFEVAD